MEIIKTKGLTKTYQNNTLKVEAVKQVDLSISEGEFTAIVGPSGSGKTTLFNMIGGLDDITAGTVFTNSASADVERRSRTQGDTPWGDLLSKPSILYCPFQLNALTMFLFFGNMPIPLFLEVPVRKNLPAQSTYCFDDCARTSHSCTITISALRESTRLHWSSSIRFRY